MKHRSLRLLLLPLATAAVALLAPSALAGTATFGNHDGLTIPAAGSTGPADPYPSEVEVAGLGGKATKVTVTLHGLTHGYLQDLQVLLVGPSGAAVALMNRVGGFGPGVTLAEYTFDRSAEAAFPENEIPASGSYRPAASAGCPLVPELCTLPAPAPGAFPYGLSLAAFEGLSPNGTWKLFVHDAEGVDTGSLAGWSLTITTAGEDPVEEALIELADKVATVGTGGSLAAKLGAAQALYESGDLAATCGTLQAFVNQVRAQRGKKIAAPLADALIADAEALRSQLGC
jgi:subtilisin-like proprotein convertase family protein